MKLVKPMLTSLVTLVILTMFVTPVNANELRHSGDALDISWDPVTFSAFNGEVVIRCDLQLEITLHSRDINKLSGTLVGHVVNAALPPESCEGGTVALLAETLPWHVRFAGWEGTLPWISGVHLEIIEASFVAEPGFSIRCLYGSTTSDPISLIAPLDEFGDAGPYTFDGGYSIPATGHFLCTDGSVEGAATPSTESSFDLI